MVAILNFGHKKNCSRVTSCHPADLCSVGSSQTEKTIKPCTYPKTRFCVLLPDYIRHQYVNAPFLWCILLAYPMYTIMYTSGHSIQTYYMQVNGSGYNISNLSMLNIT